MPQARTEIDRDTKVDEILAAAERRLLDGGYEAMSVAAIARQLGIAQNSIYWYFPSKDELLIAVVRRLLGHLAAKKPPSGRGLEAQVLWASDRMDELAPLRTQLRQRASHSDKVAEFDADLDALLRRLVMHGIEDYVESDQVDVAATAFLATVEGSVAMKLTRTQRHRVIRYALDRFVGPSR